jgi:cellulose synthase/poly-beta-1,6-N-acetylglucosamine synthase-like glycosyltransferase
MNEAACGRGSGTQSRAGRHGGVVPPGPAWSAMAEVTATAAVTVALPDRAGDSGPAADWSAQKQLETAAIHRIHQGAVSISARRSMLRSLVLFTLVPVTVLLATRIVQLTKQPVLGTYAVLMLSITTIVMYLAFAHYHDDSEDVLLDHTKPLPLVSLLVAVKDDAEMITRCVLSMLDSTYPNIEVIVVDDGSEDETPEALAVLAAQRPFTLICQANSGKKRALSAGAEVAKGDFLIFTDSDCVIHPGAVDRVMRAFTADRKLGACSGHARAYNADRNFLTRVQDTWYDGQFGVWKAAESVLGSVSCISGPLAAFRREAIYNYFPAWANDHFLGREFRFATDRQLTGYVLGQTSVGQKLKRANADSSFVTQRDYPERKWKVGYVKSARAWTAVPWSVTRLFKQQARWKKSFIRNLCFTGRFYWRRGPLPALLFYSHALFVLAMPVMAFRHLIWYPAHGRFWLCGFYLAGIFFKGSIWGIAYKVQNPGCGRWVYRPFMSIMTAIFFSTLIIYSVLTLRKGTWSRG